MGIFTKKRMSDLEHKTIDIPKLPHEHVWKDMPWYMEVEYDGPDKTAQYEIIEPYICVSCGERKNVVLEKTSWRNITPDEREKSFNNIKKKYKKYLKPRAIVEDMINNILLVKDPGRLEMFEKIRGLPHSNVGSSADMKGLLPESTPDTKEGE